eukprot:TRINITY_DN2795_c0_g1_i5.p1 TRINITY_DN2795_c0_g1~~TRINITY_DN2795_c0_g1_i5.p1  ORF type:complete len:474 (-),score=105.90 TRINITY_DN2795_c0_g1_i5:156-1577(-)
MGLTNKVLFLVLVSGCASSLLRGEIQQREKRDILDASDRAEGERISAPGGGIVQEGSNVTLSLYVGSIWDRCHWFRYDHAKAEGKHDYDTCSFDFKEETNTSSLHKCDNPKLKAMITPLSDDPYSCKIMLVNMNSDMEGKWAARLDTDKDNKEIQLIMEEDVTSIELDVKDEEVIAGDNVSVVCKAVGGKPDPVLTFMLMDGDNSTDNTTTDRFTDVKVLKTDGEISVTFQATFVPEIGDLGKSLCCKAVQKDMENNTLYETNKVLDRSLDIKFSPQPIKPDGLIELEAKIGGTATLSLLVISNPGPETAVWNIVRTENCGQDDNENTTALALTSCTFDIRPGHSDDKYIASNITEMEGETNLYKLDLQVLNINTDDYTTNYTATVENSAGQQAYHFHLSENLPSTTESSKITGESTESTPNSDSVEDAEGGASPGMVVMLVIFSLMGIITGIVFYKKRQSNDIESTPLTNTH